MDGSQEYHMAALKTKRAAILNDDVRAPFATFETVICGC
jgi:hypothetical protein